MKGIALNVTWVPLSISDMKGITQSRVLHGIYDMKGIAQIVTWVFPSISDTKEIAQSVT